MLLYVLIRVLLGAGVVAVTACFAYGGWRALRGDVPQNRPWLAGSLADLGRVVLHGDLGEACSVLTGAKSRPCPAISGLLARGWQADVWMLVGAIGIGTAAGVAAGLWCAVHPRAWRARALEGVAMLGLCTPPFVLGLGLLLLFEPTFGQVEVPLLFTVNVYEQPYADPVGFLRAMTVPWLVAATPVFAIVLRITRSTVVETADEDFIRTAVAKGLSPAKALFRHGRPLANVAAFSWLGTAPALIVTNVLITESVFSVPGFLVHTRRAFKPPGDPEAPDITLLQAEAVWVAVLVVAVAVVSDLLVRRQDPRVRTSVYADLR